jgi:hypothetical protein
MSDQTVSKPMGMLLQDPTLRDEGREYLHTDYEFSLKRDFLVGTGSAKFMVRDEDENGVPMFSALDWSDPDTGLAFQDFNQRPFERPLRDNPQFHQVNLFAVAAHTLRSVEKALGRQITWKHGGPLVMRPHAFVDTNAYYDPLSPSLNFGYFDSPFRPETIWTCLSHDIIAHELGHAILDSLRPLFALSTEIDTPALHEAFGDINALFSALEHLAVVDRVYRESDGDMRRPTLISGLAEEFGIGLKGSGTPYLRSALEGPPYDEAPKEPHARSTVWTAAVYEILSEEVATLAPPGTEAYKANFDEFKQAVVTATDLTRAMLIRALHYAPPTGVTMPVLAQLVYEADRRRFPDAPGLRDIAKQVFGRRGLWDDSIELAPPGIGQAFEGFKAAGAAARVKMVVDHAEALRIPTDLSPRILTPHLTRATRRVVGAEEDKRAADRGVVKEQYLHFAYELTDLIPTWDPSGEPVYVGIAILQGGTLVMDENFNDVMLVTDPPAFRADARAGDPARQALVRATDRFQATHGRAIQAIQSDGLSVDSDTLYEGSAFRLMSHGAGAARLIARPCNIAEHLHAISQPQPRFSFVSRLGFERRKPHHGPSPTIGKS